MKDQSLKKISELKSGDEILTNEEGFLKPDVFIGFLHENKDEHSEYLEISFETSR